MKHRLACIAVLASALAPADPGFTAGPPVAWQGEVERAGELHRIPVSEAMYRALGDRPPERLRVRNADGEPVAGELIRAERLFDRKTERRLALPVFTVPASAVDESGEWRVSVAVDDAGRIENVDVEGGKTETVSGPPSWLLDSGDPDRAPERLEIDWQGAEAPFTGRLRISGSDDLDNWRRIDSAVVAELSGDGHRLVRDEIELAGSYRYYRLDPEELPAGWRLSDVTAVTGMDAAVPLEKHTTRVGPETDGREPAIAYPLGGPMPVTGIRVLDDGPFVLRARLLAGPADGRYGIGRTTFYSLTHDDARLEKRYLGVDARRAPKWWLEGDNGAIAPTLAFEWYPDQLVFLPRAAGTYYVDVVPEGEEAPPTANPGITTILESTGSGVETLPVLAVGPADADFAALDARERPVDWQRITLWIVLVLASLVLIVIGWRLIRPGSSE